MARILVGVLFLLGLAWLLGACESSPKFTTPEWARTSTLRGMSGLPGATGPADTKAAQSIPSKPASSTSDKGIVNGVNCRDDVFAQNSLGVRVVNISVDWDECMWKYYDYDGPGREFTLGPDWVATVTQNPDPAGQNQQPKVYFGATGQKVVSVTGGTFRLMKGSTNQHLKSGNNPDKCAFLAYEDGWGLEDNRVRKFRTIAANFECAGAISNVGTTAGQQSAQSTATKPNGQTNAPAGCLTTASQVAEKTKGKADKWTQPDPRGAPFTWVYKDKGNFVTLTVPEGMTLDVWFQRTGPQTVSMPGQIAEQVDEGTLKQLNCKAA